MNTAIAEGLGVQFRYESPVSRINVNGSHASGVTLENGQTLSADDRWRAFMKFQIERDCLLYQEALPGIALLDPDGRFAIAAAAELYRAILQDIEAHDGDVFH